MPEQPPILPDQLEAFYQRVAQRFSPELQSNREAQLVVANYNLQLYRDMLREAEMRMAMYDKNTSSRFLLGMCSALIAMDIESSGLPPLDEARYRLDRDIQAHHQVYSDHMAKAYFIDLELSFSDRFPMTRMVLAAQGAEMRDRFGASDIDIDEGFNPGWFKAARAVMPLFSEQIPPDDVL